MPPKLRPQTLTSFLATLPSPLPPPTSRSPVLRGTLYEYTVQASLLQSLPGLTLRRMGGAGDGGVDLLGSWTLPGLKPESEGEKRPSIGTGTGSNQREKGKSRRRVEVLVQCKSFATPGMVGPKMIRELSGALSNTYYPGSSSFLSSDSDSSSLSSPDSDFDTDTDSESESDLDLDTPTVPSKHTSIGILATPFPCTKSLSKAIIASREWGMMVVHVRDFDEGGGVVGVVWNDKAREVLGGSVVVRGTRGGVRVRVVGED